MIALCWAWGCGDSTSRFADTTRFPVRSARWSCFVQLQVAGSRQLLRRLARFNGFEQGLETRVISQRCQTGVAPKVCDAFVAAGDSELQPLDRFGWICLQSIKVSRPRRNCPGQPRELQ